MRHPSVRRDSGDVTHLLRAWSTGEVDAFDRVLPLVYDELHRMAARCLVGERPTASVQPTALVNDVCVRLIGWTPVTWQNRAHFFGVSARMMRRVLIDIARRRRANRRGGPRTVQVSLDQIDVPGAARTPDLLALDDALEALASEHPRQADVVELRFFGGLSVEETAEALGVSIRTVHADWAFARAWLFRRLSDATAD